MKPFALSLAALLLTATAIGQTIEVGEDRAIDLASIKRPIVEPHLSVNPADSNRLLGGAMAARADGTTDSIVLSSADGGRNWISSELSPKSGDVRTVFLPDGTALYSTVVDTAEHPSQIRVFRSLDGGRTWPAQTTFGDRHDHPVLVADASNVYAVAAGYAKGSNGKMRSAIFVYRSTDGGASFGAASYAVASNLDCEPESASLLSDGTLLVAFADHHRPGMRRRLEHPRTWLVRASGGGQTFTEPMLISESCGGVAGWSSLAVDHSSSHRDRIFHLCGTDNLDGIYFRISDTRGEEWTAPLRIDHPGDVAPLARTPAIAINDSGIVAIAWYDARNDRSTIKGAMRCQEIFFTASLDGGETFLPEVKVSSAKSCPGTAENVSTALRFPAGGDYMGLAPEPDGSFRLLWADARSGRYELRTAIVRISPTSVKSGTF